MTLKIIYGLLENSKIFNISLATDQKVISNDIKIITKEEQVKNAIIVSPVTQINYLKL